MCGIFGAVNVKLSEEKALYCLNQLKHRGPDGYGLWQKDGVTLGHRRLAILDLTDNGKQPMSYANERYWLVFNGEIFNFLEIRKELEEKGYHFKSDSDSEVVLASFMEWKEACQDKFNGMWAIAIWDMEEKKLFLSRDRFGVKPLYYAQLPDGGLAFASEMKSISPLLNQVEADMEALALYRSRVHYEDKEECIIKGIKRFPAGCSGWFQNGSITIKRWWNTLDHLMDVPQDYDKQVEMFRELFLDACKIRMRSDVTIGTALSGGLDSSASICAMAHIAQNGGTGRMADDWQHAYVACFPGTSLDESAYARKVTDYLGIESTFLNVEDTVSLEELYRYIYEFEELYTNMQVPMIKIYEQERKYGTLVSIDGHGADELFGGYSFDIVKALPDAKDTDEINAIVKTYMDMNCDGDVPVDCAEFKKTKRRLAYDIMAKQKIKKLIGRPVVNSAYSNHPAWKELDNLNKTLFVSTHETILPTLLRNYDRTSMINGIEIRMPFMDYRLVQFAFSIGWRSKIRNGFSKNIIRDAIAPFMPEEIAYRRGKIGFNAPVLDWIKGPYREMFLDMTSSQDYVNSTLLKNPAKTRELLQDVLDGKTGFHEASMVWDELQIFMWEQVFLKGKGISSR
ncbi:MAG: asparagine synthase (glutamine-hydrolyzing) [Thermoflexaceae bacterium]|nr:asparagine synthase (glutamine-hydrolyzing) [Thermoflexaceae bacterium]